VVQLILQLLVAAEVVAAKQEVLLHLLKTVYQEVLVEERVHNLILLQDIQLDLEQQDKEMMVVLVVVVNHLVHLVYLDLEVVVHQQQDLIELEAQAVEVELVFLQIFQDLVQVTQEAVVEDQVVINQVVELIQVLLLEEE
tara:strand:- start:340 stop:759 length:420 start_codon:yes stop_codon:yes gene_type:complete